MATRIAIIGTGAIGTSLGLALRQNGQNMTVIGHDKNPERAQESYKRGALDKTEWNLLNAVDGADVVILSIPLHEIRETLRVIGPEMRANSVVTDTAPLKAPVQEWAYKILPPRVHFVGGNPLVHTQGSGPAAGRVDLFQGKRYSLTPTPKTEGGAVEALTNMVSILGAEPLYLDPSEHDGLVSGVTQLPVVTSLAVLSVTTSHPAWREMSQMAGTTFGNATRLPAESAPELVGLLHADRATLLRWVDDVQAELTRLKSLIEAESSEPLEARLVELLVARSRWAEKGEPDPILASYDEVKQSSNPVANLFGLRGRRKK
jgi:prephenate dehydrogenase